MEVGVVLSDLEQHWPQSDVQMIFHIIPNTDICLTADFFLLFNPYYPA